MAASNLTFIPDLDVTRDDLTFKLHGNKIQATVSKRNIYRFKNIAWHFTSKVQSLHAALKIDTFKLTPQDQKLTFIPQTVVTECNDFSGHEFGFSFVDYQNILSFAHPQDKSIDVMGLIVAVTEIQRDNPDKSKHKLNINIEDAKGLQLHVYLWGDYAYKMQEYIHNNPHNRRIVVNLQFGQINVFRDRPSVNTYFTSSKLFINSHIDEIIRFNKSLDGDDGPYSSTNTFSVIPSNQHSEYDDFMIKNKLNAISEVWEPVEIFDFRNSGHYKGNFIEKKWYYKACTNYFGKAVPSDGSDDQQTKSYVCHNGDCTKDTTFVVPRFMIPIRVQDNTGTLTLTMFERDGKYLLKQSAKELDSLDSYPGEINALKGLKLTFKIFVKNFNVTKKTTSMVFLVARISEDASIIEQLQNKLNDSQPSNEQSLDFGSADLQSQDIKNAKDAISGTDDNITPSALDKNETTSPMKTLTTTPILKRNLKEVFDLESNDHLSSTKTPKITPDGPGK
uniref:Replication factor A C-terminal domain-containing protein n=1 Tax=Lactuca sativa TaxID=4236 RepID=A0A9R1WWT0_LACSA|nr:hypothetical protein LSAT_V11C800413510 [Lactuca sativa]